MGEDSFPLLFNNLLHYISVTVVSTEEMAPTVSSELQMDSHVNQKLPSISVYECHPVQQQTPDCRSKATSARSVRASSQKFETLFLQQI